jgi:hypothetical protein
VSAEDGTLASFNENRETFKLHRKFAVIKLWPELTVAVDEWIARLRITARSLGLECLMVDSFARLIDPPHTQLTAEDLDFVLSLHLETPKRDDIFSFVALWNPLQFFHDWGYRGYSRNLLTHDDSLSCSSPWDRLRCEPAERAAAALPRRDAGGTGVRIPRADYARRWIEKDHRVVGGQDGYGCLKEETC